METGERMRANVPPKKKNMRSPTRKTQKADYLMPVVGWSLKGRWSPSPALLPKGEGSRTPLPPGEGRGEGDSNRALLSFTSSISNIASQQNRPDVIVMAITSQIRPHLNVGNIPCRIGKPLALSNLP